MKRQTSKPNRFVVRTLAEVATVMGVTTRQIGEYLTRGCPGRKGSYPLPAMIAWAKENVWKAKPSPSALPASLPSDADLLAGPDTPSLERMRKARAELYEMDVEERRQQSVPAATLGVILAETSGLIRDAAANLERRFGPEARDEFDATLTNLEQRCEREWGGVHAG